MAHLSLANACSESDVPQLPRSPSNQSTETSNEHLKVNQTMSFKTKQEDDKIRNSKLMFPKEGVSENDKTLKLDLRTNHELVRRLYVKIPSNNQIVDVHAHVESTIDIVKSIVVVRVEGLDINGFDLMFQGQFLNGNQTLVSINGLTDCSLLYLVTRPKDTMTIEVVAPLGRVVIEVKKFNTIGDIKVLVASMLNLPAEGAKMIYSGAVMKEEKTIASYDIGDDKCILLITRYPVNVQLLSGRSIKVSVYPTDDGKRVVQRTLWMFGIPYHQFDLFFNNEKLLDGKSLWAYKVYEGSTVVLGVPSIPTQR